MGKGEGRGMGEGLLKALEGGGRGDLDGGR